MTQARSLLLFAALGASFCLGCNGSGSSGTAGSASGALELVKVTNGFGDLLPHKAFSVVDGEVTSQVISLRTMDDLLENVVSGNDILPPQRFPESSILPGGGSGNHFLMAEFTKPLDVDSVLSVLPSNDGLAGTITVVALDPQTGDAVQVAGRGFIAGQTRAGSPSGPNNEVPLQTWVEFANGVATANPLIDNNNDGVPDGLGFPGSEGGFAGMDELFSPSAFVFVVDSDYDLTTHETFPEGFEVRMKITTEVYSDAGRQLEDQASACTTVGPDASAPEVLFTPPPNPQLSINPTTLDGEGMADPLTSILVEFSEAVQPWSLGDLPSNRIPEMSAAMTIEFGPPAMRTSVPFSVEPVSIYDLTAYEIKPAFNFPGEGPPSSECGAFNLIDITVMGGQFRDLAGNTNTLPGNKSFQTGEGPGIVNAPVTPDTIYVGRGGGAPGLSIIDLNGFGQSTGNPTFDLAHPTVEGNTNFPNNPNVRYQGTTLVPALAPGTCTVNGGSAGVFTLTKDSSLNDKVARNPVVRSIGDMMLGWGLDLVFNNGPSPFGCQGGGGNPCAHTGFKSITTVIDGSSLSPGITNPNGTQIIIDGGPNMVSWSPHPNPPPLVFPPLCISPYLGGQEPTSIYFVWPPPPQGVPPGLGQQNFLISGNPFGFPAQDVPPDGLLSSQGSTFFQGPSPTAHGGVGGQGCIPFGLRQQIGQFLYVVDRGRREVVVLNSNRMTVVDRIVLPDPTSLAIGTNLDVLAVSNQGADLVSFIDIDPSSSSFHQVLKHTQVGGAPRGLAWEPGNEDLLVCNEMDSTMSIISAFSLEVRRTLNANLNQPFDVCITPRQLGFGLARNTYFAYILNRNGQVAIYESGPNAVNGWGYDDIVGVTPQNFRNPKAIQPDQLDLRGAFWVAHEGRLDPETEQLIGSPTEGAVSNVGIVSGSVGQIGLTQSTFGTPNFRDMAFGVKVSIGEERLSGVPVDLAFDTLTNFAGVVNWTTQFSAGSPTLLNGKSIVRTTGGVTPTNAPHYAFFAIPNPSNGTGVVDVVLLDAAHQRFDTNAFQPGVQSIPATECTVLMDYFRQ